VVEEVVTCRVLAVVTSSTSSLSSSLPTSSEISPALQVQVPLPTPQRPLRTPGIPGASPVFAGGLAAGSLALSIPSLSFLHSEEPHCEPGHCRCFTWDRSTHGQGWLRTRFFLVHGGPGTRRAFAQPSSQGDLTPWPCWRGVTVACGPHGNPLAAAPGARGEPQTVRSAAPLLQEAGRRRGATRRLKRKELRETERSR
jgi:hypothetical protein